MGFTLVGPWNCTWKATVFPYIGNAWGLHWSTHERAHIKTLSCHSLELHGSMLVTPWSCPCKTTVLPIIDIAWSSHWLAQETAHVKPLFCQTLALHGLHIDEPLASCMIVHFSAHNLEWELVCKFGVRFHIFIYIYIISCLGSRFHAWN